MAKYLKRFEDHYSLSGNSYVDFSIGEDYITPSVSVCDDEYDIHYNEFNEADNWVNEAYNSEQKNLRFTATANGCKIALKRFWKKYTKAKPNGYPYANDLTTFGWTEVTSAQTVSVSYLKNGVEMGSYKCGTIIEANSGETIEFYRDSSSPYASGEYYFSNMWTGKKEINIYSFATSGGAFYADGNVNSLLRNPADWRRSNDFGEYGEKIHMAPYSFFALFLNSTNLCFGGICNIRGKLVLPSLILSEGCYAEMFVKSLITTVYLPSTNLAPCCYNLMFYRSFGLESITLPATTLVDNCYSQMFRGCKNLKEVKCLALEEPTSAATNEWLGAYIDDASQVPKGVFYQNPDAEWTTASTIASWNWEMKKI